MKPLLSLCMIVRNESELLERCLQSVSSIVDEIIIVDTGSTDATKQIAAHYTSQIYDLEWTQDFAVARNTSIAKASGQWILILDADEYIDSTNFELLKTFLHSHNNREPIGVILPVFNFVGALNSGKVSRSNAIRLFTRHPDLSFVRPIHEQLQSRTGSLIELELEMPIYHTGYTEETIAYKQKTNRNEAIFQKMKEQGLLTPYDSFTLGNEYLVQDRYQEALSCYLEADQLSELNKSWLPQCKGNRINCLMKLHQYTEAYAQIKLAKNRWSNVCDFYLLEGYLLAQIGMDKEAIQSLETCILIAEKKSEHPTYLISPNYGSTLPLQQLFIIYSRLFDTQKAVFYLTKLCYASPNNLTVLLQLIKLIATPEQSDHIETFIHSLYPNPTPNQLVMILDVFVQLGFKSLSTLIWRRCGLENINLSVELILNYSVLHEDWTLLQQTLIQLPDGLDKKWDISIYRATMIWPQYKSELRKRLSTEFTADPATIVVICLALFNQGRYDQYDELIGRHQEHFEVFANLLGDAFYADRQYELALDYYSLLLEREALSGQGYENLARLYFMQGETAEGLDFAEKALELSPERIDLSMLLLLNISDSSRKIQIQSKLQRLYPGLLHFPIAPL
jgi:glycosyltransferase involved in cell wall biosynthesis